MPDNVRVQGPRQGRQARRGSARGRQRAARRQQAALDGLRAHRDPAAGRQDALRRDLKIPGFSDRIKLKDVAVFSRQFATMINSGLSLLRVARTSSPSRPRASRSPRSSTRCASTSRGARRSRPRSRSTRRRSTASTSRWCGPVRSAVCSTACCMRLADTIEKQVELRRKVKSAMTYPAVVGVLVLRHRHRDAAVRHPDVREHLHGARRQAAAADADPDQHLERRAQRTGT